MVRGPGEAGHWTLLGVGRGRNRLRQQRLGASPRVGRSCYGRAVANLRIVVVTGMSGAGRSTALNVLEDLGFFCVDNLPPALIPGVVDLVLAGKEIRRIGFGLDVRTGMFLEGAKERLDELQASGHAVEVLFLDASDEILVRRFSETRRPHPLAPFGDVQGAILAERERLASLRARSKQVLDTTGLNVHELRRRLSDYLQEDQPKGLMVVRLVSFGFKYGVPVDADLMFDLRYLPNPHFVPDLKPHTGLNSDVSSYVLTSPDTEELLEDLERFLGHTIPRYEREGKAYLTVAIGCTGGRHRSVAVAEELGKRLPAERKITVSHRDIRRGDRTSAVG
ncbi:MAG: RNase adapter RapZ [Myxococcales bacterium]|nr:RNase adapter RapZ [Myxococcales bacterium]